MLQRRHTPLHVIHLVLQLETGGMEKLLVEFARHVDRSRFDLRFVSMTTRGVVASEIEALGWPVHAMREPAGLRPGMVLRLARQFRRWNADVVHVHNTKPLIYGGPAARLARVRRVIYTRHGQRHLASRGQSLLFRLASRTTDQIVCVSADAAALCDGEGLAAEKVVSIWNGIDIRRFPFAGPCGGGPVVAVGRLSPEKDFQTLIRAAAIVARALPGLRLEIAGDGPCKAELEALTAQLGVQTNIRFLGEVRDVASLLGTASMFVLPSLTEGISLTLLEAMSRGLPVVATRVGGNTEVVAHGRTGLLVSSGAAEEMAAAMLRLLADAAEARRMGSAGRTRVESCFDARVMAKRYESLYEARPRTGLGEHDHRSVGRVPSEPPCVSLT